MFAFGLKMMMMTCFLLLQYNIARNQKENPKNEEKKLHEHHRGFNKTKRRPQKNF
jgi:hypothetical protein